jgi:plastocyanin
MHTQQTATSNKAWQAMFTPFTWRKLLHIAAIGDLIVLVAMGVALRDRLPLGLAVVIAFGWGLLNVRSGWPGAVVLGLIFADTTFWTLGAALANVVHGEEFIRLVLPALLAASSGAGMVAAVAGLVWRKDPEAGRRAARYVGLGAVAFFVLAVATGFVAGRGASRIDPPASLVLRTENMAFTTTELVADSGQVTVVVDNQDLWWHTFTIDELGVNLNVPSSGKRQVTFTAAPGTYTFYCGIPGHKDMGMQGTLVVP